MGEEAQGSSGPYKRLAIVAVVIAVALVSVAIALPFVLQAIAQPNIVLTETDITEGFCFDDTVFVFTLVNTGDADGFANVQFLIDGRVEANINYFVPAASFVPKSFSVLVNDCVSHTGSITIASYWKA